MSQDLCTAAAELTNVLPLTSKGLSLLPEKVTVGAAPPRLPDLMVGIATLELAPALLAAAAAAVVATAAAEETVVVVPALFPAAAAAEEVAAAPVAIVVLLNGAA